MDYVKFVHQDIILYQVSKNVYKFVDYLKQEIKMETVSAMKDYTIFKEDVANVIKIKSIHQMNVHV